jgi:hypothetical protein
VLKQGDAEDRDIYETGQPDSVHLVVMRLQLSGRSKRNAYTPLSAPVASVQ